MRGIFMLILSSADRLYLPYLRSLYASIKQNVPRARILFEIYDARSEDLEGFDYLDACGFIAADVKHVSDYLANYRALKMYELIEAGEELVVWVDADSLVLGDICELESVEFDVAAFMPGEVDNDRCRYLISTVAVRGNAMGLEFAKRWASSTESLKESMCPDICRVQVAFAQVMKRLRVDFYPLPAEYCDYHFNAGSKIWEAHSTRKSLDSVWMAAQEKYLNAFYTREWAR